MYTDQNCAPRCPCLIRGRSVIPGARSLTLKELVGTVWSAELEHGAVPVVPVPHPSGVGRWLNDPGNRALVDRAVQWFDEQGAIVEPAEPDASDAKDIFMAHWFGIGHAAFSTLPEEKRKLMDPGLRDVIERGAGYALPQFVEADFARRALGYEFSSESAFIVLFAVLGQRALGTARKARDLAMNWRASADE